MMDERLKERLVGATVLVALAVIFVPFVLGPSEDPDPSEGVNQAGARPSSPVVKPPSEPPRSQPASIAVTKPENPSVNPPPASPPAEWPVAEQAPSGTNQNNSSRPAAEPLPEDNQPPSQTVEPTTISVSASVGSGGSAAPSASKPGTNPSTQTASPAVKEKPPAPKKVATTQPAATDSGGWVVQLATFSKADNALALRDKLAKQGYDAFVGTGRNASGSVVRVYVGPTTSRLKAASLVGPLEKASRLRGMVVREP